MIIDHDNLEEFADAERYDREQRAGMEPIISFYVRLARRHQDPVLDLACGTGLVTIPLAYAGCDITGVDAAPAMLALARRKTGNLPIEWVEADVRALRLGRQFRLITMTGNAFQAMLTRDDQDALLATVASHLRPDGVFAFETRNPRAADLITIAGEEPWETYRDPDGTEIVVTGTQRFDPETQIMHWTTYRRWKRHGQPHQRVTRIATRYSGLPELESLLADHGLEIRELYGHWDRTALADASPSIIIVCGPRLSAAADEDLSAP